MTNLKKSKTIINVGVGVGPCWRGDKLWLSDIHGCVIYTLGRDGKQEKVINVPGQPSSIGFLPDGIPLIVSIHDCKLMKLVNAKFRYLRNMSL